MSKLSVNELTDEAGTGAPSFPNGVSVTGAALTDPEITGGIYLGGTGSANYLDDYEEGTWTPRLFGDNGEITDAVYESIFTSGVYVKVGGIVTLNGAFRLDSKGSIGNTEEVRIGNFPFIVKNDGTTRSRTSATLTIATGLTISGTDSVNGHIIFESESELRLRYYDTSAGTNIPVTGSDISNGLYIQGIGITYSTDS